LTLTKTGPGVDTIIKQTTTTTTTPPHPTTKLFKGGNLEFLLSDCSEFQREDQFNAIIKQANPHTPHWQDEGGGMGKKTIFAKMG